MNNKRRKQIETVRTTLEALMVTVETIRDEEQEAYDNLPDSLQDGTRGERMTEAIDSLESALDNLNDANDALEEAAQ